MCEQDRNIQAEIHKYRNSLKVWPSSNTSERPLKINSSFVKKWTAYWILIMISTIWYSTFRLRLGFGAQKIWKLQYIELQLLPVISYWCPDWSVTVRGEGMVTVFGNRLLRKIFGHKMEVVYTGLEKTAECVPLSCTPQ